jgi:hypothetical protein
MFWKSKKRTHRYYRKTKRIKMNFWTKLGSKFLWISIAFLTLLLLIYAFSFYRKLSQPEASEFGSRSTEPGKTTSVRVQILNGCPEQKGKGLAQKLSQRLEQLHSGNLEYEIVELENCDWGSQGLEDSLYQESMIIDRAGGEKEGSPSEVALQTARILGISPRNVICKRLKHNYQNISLTLLIGNDYKNILSEVSK